MTPDIVPETTPMKQLADIYTQESSAFVIAMVAIRRSTLPFEARTRLYSLLDQRLEQTRNARDVERFSRTCLRVARFYQKRARP